jgi:hypothetical protein
LSWYSHIDPSRDDKRYTEKKNKSERARRKKEDTARLRTLVDLTLSVDPRIKRIKQEEKDAREAKKKTKGGVPANQKAKLEDEKKKAEEEAKQKEEEEKVRLALQLPTLLSIIDTSPRSPALRQRKLKRRLLTRQKRPGDRNVLPRKMTLSHNELPTRIWRIYTTTLPMLCWAIPSIEYALSL